MIDPATRLRRIAVLVNPHSGPAGMVAAEHVAVLFAGSGVEAAVEACRGADLAAAAAAALATARRGELDAITVAGGDGSVGTVAGVLAGTGVPLGILPLGTFNHFARAIGLPLDLAAAAGVITAGHQRAVDLGEVNGCCFVNNSSIGIYPYMVVDRERRRGPGHPDKARLDKSWAMLLAVFRAIRRFPLRRLSVRFAGQIHRTRTPCLFVGNNAYELGLLRLGQRAALDRGELGFVLVDHNSPWGLLKFGIRAALGRLDADRDFGVCRLPSVEVMSSASRVWVSVDGEVAVMRPPLRYRSRPGALQVLAPAA